MKTTSIGWHVLYVKSRHERKVYDALKELSIDVFLPTVTEQSKRVDRKAIIQKLLFPSYVFVNISSSMDFYKTLSVNGACAYIRFGVEYATVRDVEIKKIKLLIGADDLTEFETDVDHLKVGDIKKISYGSLSGLECEILNVNNTNKVIIRINSLQQSIKATIPSYYFEN